METGTRPSTYQPRREECGFFNMRDAANYAQRSDFIVKVVPDSLGVIEATRPDVATSIFQLEKDPNDGKWYWERKV